MRLAALSLSASGFARVRGFAERSGHELVLLVTIPAPANDLISRLGGVDPATAVYIAPDVAGCAEVLRAHDLDLAIVASFSILDAATAALPRHGTVNLHPALLPAFAGPNALRELFSGAPQIGATLHWLVDAVDGGPILAQASVPVPDDITPARAAELLAEASATVLDEGVPRALAGAVGSPQDAAHLPPGRSFDDAERMLDANLPRHIFQARFAALTLAGAQPTVSVGGAPAPVRSVTRIDGVSTVSPGVIHHVGRRALLATADGLLELELGPLAIV